MSSGLTVIGVNATTSVWMTSIYGFNGKDLDRIYLAVIVRRD